MTPGVKTALILGGIAAFTVPIFSSGERRNLSFARWVWGHTRWGPYPLYVPRELAEPPEDYLLPAAEIPQKPLSGAYYLIQKRFGEEWRDLREWITPHAPMVREYAEQLYDADRDTFILNCWEWVCSSFSYPRSDFHQMAAFYAPFQGGRVYRQQDFWHTPTEMIGFYEEWAKGKTNQIPLGNCEDTVFLVASLLLAKTDRVYANVELERVGHAWCSVERGGREYALETTLRGSEISELIQTGPWTPAESMPVPDFKFDHQDIYT